MEQERSIQSLINDNDIIADPRIFLNPDDEAMVKTNEFLKDLHENCTLKFNKDEIIVECRDIDLNLNNS